LAGAPKDGEGDEGGDLVTTGDPVIAPLEEEWAAIGELGLLLSDQEWDMPSECPGWSVKDVVSHMVGTESSLLGEPSPAPVDPVPSHVHNSMGASNEAWVQMFRSNSGPEVLALFVEVTRRRLSELRASPVSRFEQLGPSPVGEAPYREFLQVRVMDCWVHEQDMRVATGRPGHRSGPAAELSVDRLASAMGFVVGKKARAPEAASVRFDVAGVTDEQPRRLDIEVRDGRAVAVDHLAGEPTAVVKLDLEAFWRLACGRVQGEAALSAGLVELTGDEDLAHRVVDNMGFMI